MDILFHYISECLYASYMYAVAQHMFEITRHTVPEKFCNIVFVTTCIFEVLVVGSQ